MTNLNLSKFDENEGEFILENDVHENYVASCEDEQFKTNIKSGLVNHKRKSISITSSKACILQ